MWKGNKGEWSELYTFLKLLSEGKLYAADSNLERIHDIYYPLIKILRLEKGVELQYFYTDEMIILEDKASNSSVKMPVSEFKHKSLLLLEEIKKAKGRSFSISKIEDFLHAIQYDTLKAKSTDKSDIRIMVHDPITGMHPTLGFSIKSRLGGSSTLFNAGKSTNFVYKVSGDMNDEDMRTINNIEGKSKIRARVKAIKEKGLNLEFNGVPHEMFNLNLQVIDSRMPAILAALLEYHYTGQGSRVFDLLQQIQADNPCDFNSALGHDFYEYKIKNFMIDVALGMTPSKVWTGKFDATGGYIVVKEDGEVLCYHVYNHNEFQNYLLNNVKLETPSSTRHDFGKIHKVNNEYFINLNLQLRFI